MTENTVFDFAPIKYSESGLAVLDQTRLPGEEIYIKIENKEDIWEAIYHLKVRGAPAIGVAASYGLCIEAGRFEGDSISEFIRFTKEAAAYIQTARPTAVNLS